MKKVKYSFLYYSIFLSIIVALISGLQNNSLIAFLSFAILLTAFLLVTRYVYQLLEGLGVKVYENHIQSIIEKIHKAQKEAE